MSILTFSPNETFVLLFTISFAIAKPKPVPPWALDAFINSIETVKYFRLKSALGIPKPSSEIERIS